MDPPVNGQNQLSYIKWTLPGTDAFAVAPDETLSLLYDMVIPNPSSVSTKFTNTAYVRSFGAFTDETGQLATYYPQENIDITVTEDMWDAPVMNDPSDVFIRDASVTKTAETSVGETGNDVPNQATIGETITYTYSVTIPAGSTVYNGVLSDALPNGIDLRSILSAQLDGGALPGDFPAFDTDITTNPTGRLDFPATYSNTTATDQVFAVKVTAQVTKTAVACANETSVCPVPPSPTASVSKTNTARFASNATLGGAALPAKEGTKLVRIVQPNPTVVKSATPTQLTTANQEVTFTVTLSNPGGSRPPLHGPTMIDCLPAPMEVTSIVSVTAPATANEITLPCDGIRVDIGQLNGGQTITLVYKAKLVGSVPASQPYTNTATLTGSSMSGSVAGEREYETSKSATITSPLLIREKTTTPEKLPVGDRFTSTIRLGLLADVNYYSAAVIDTLPNGVNPASMQQVSITCQYTVSQQPCDPPVNGSPLTPSGQKIGWSFGDVLGAGQADRVVSIVYSAMVDDVAGNVAGTPLTNSAKPFWSRTSVQTPPTTIAGFEALPATTDPVSDTVTVTEPTLSIVKKVDGQDAITATPGQTFTYTLKVTNATGPNVSAANDITVTDSIPASIEVVGSPSDGGQVSGSTITWTINSLATGADKTLSFEARLKAPASGKQTNTATIGEYYGLPSKLGRKYTGGSDTADVTAVLPLLTIEKKASDALAYINEPYSWTIVVSNASGATAYGVDVEDIMPPNWTYKAKSAQWVVTGGTPTSKEPTGTAPNIAWDDIADLPTGKTLTITFQADPGPGVVQSPGVGLGTNHINFGPRTSWTSVHRAGMGNGNHAGCQRAHRDRLRRSRRLTKTHDNQNPAVGKDEVVPGHGVRVDPEGHQQRTRPEHGTVHRRGHAAPGTEFRGYKDGTGWSCNAVGQKVTCTNPGTGRRLAKDASLADLVLTVYVDRASPAT